MADLTYDPPAQSLSHIDFSYLDDGYDVTPVTITVESDMPVIMDDPPVSPAQPQMQPSNATDRDLLSPPVATRSSRSHPSNLPLRKRSSSVPPVSRPGLDSGLLSPSTPNLLEGRQSPQIDIALPPPPLCELIFCY